MATDTEHIERVAAAHDWKHLVTDDRYVQFAAPLTAGGRGCPHCRTQTNGPAFDWIEDGREKGTWGGRSQCGGCGSLGLGWMLSDVVDLDTDDVDVAAESFKDRVAKRLEDVTVGIEERLRGELRDALDAISGGDDVADVARGSATEPGVYPEVGGLIAWDFDPRDPYELISVGEHDLA